MARTLRTRWIRLAALLFPLAALGLAGAAPGDLDPTFGPLPPLPDGIPGIVVVDVDPALAAPAVPSDFERTTAMVIQPDGKIVVSGTVGSRLGLIRLNPDGSLDTTFSGDGIVLTDFAPDNASEFGGLALAIDGGIVKIVAAVPVSGKFGVIRYNADGTPDTTFGGTGIVLTPFVEGVATPEAVLVQPGGAILVAGSVGSDVALARYNSNGTLDTVGFGAGTGKVVADFGASESVQAAVLQGDAILVGGVRRVTVAPDTHPGDFFLARFNSDGTKDLTFGTAGLVTTDFQDLLSLSPGATYSSDVVTALALQPDGRIVAAGYFEDDDGAGDTFLLARYNALDGSPDTSFGNTDPSDGRTTGPTDFGEAVVLQPDGKIVVGGSQNGDFAVARYTAAGLPDGTFGAGGVVVHGVGGDQFDLIVGIGLQPNGQIVAAGIGGRGALTSDDFDFVVARYVNPPTIDSASVTPSLLWPPNHKMVPVVVTVEASDETEPPTCSITGITSSEPVNGPGDGNTAPDWLITGPLTAELRAERSGGGSGRVYTLTVECVDLADNATATQVVVTVPRSKKK